MDALPFGLQRPPFEDTPDPAMLVRTRAWEVVVGEIDHRLVRGNVILWCTGAAGTGKTLLGRVLADNYASRMRVLSVTPAATGHHRFLQAIAKGTAAAAESPQVRKLVDALRADDGRPVVVVVDAVERLVQADWRDAVALIRRAESTGLRLGVVMLGGAADAGPTGRRERRVVHRTTDLVALTDAEVGTYIEQRLQLAGGAPAGLFTEAGAAAVAAITGGMPRRINRLCRTLLRRAAKQQWSSIDEEHVRTLSREKTDMTKAGPSDDSSVETAAIEKPMNNAMSADDAILAEKVMAADKASPVAEVPHAVETAPAAEVASLVEVTKVTEVTEVTQAAERLAGVLPDAKRVESIVARFEELLASAPARIESTEDAIRRLEARADGMVTQASNKVDALKGVDGLAVETAADFEERLVRMERATAKAAEIEGRLSEIAQEIARVGRTAEERISLLLTSLDTAQAIHDKLEGVGMEAGQLVDASRQQAMDERDKLEAMFNELATSREQLSVQVSRWQTERQEAQVDHERTLAEQRQQVASSIEDATHRNEAMVQRVTQLSAEAQTMLDSASNAASDIDERLAALRQVQQRTEALTVEAARQNNGLTESIDRAATTTEQVRRMAGKVEAEAASAVEAVTQAESGARARVTAVQEKLEAQLASRQAAIGDTIERTTQAVEQRLVQSQAAAVDTIEQTAKDAEQRLAAGVKHLQTLNESYKSASERAEQMHSEADDRQRQAEQLQRQANAMLEHADESEQRLAAAQESAINIKSAASTALVAVQKQVKRIEDTVTTVVDHGVARLQAECDQIVEDSVNGLTDARTAAADQVTAARAETDAARAEIDVTRDAARAEIDAARAEIGVARDAARTLADAQVEQTQCEVEQLCTAAEETIRTTMNRTLAGTDSELQARAQDAIQTVSVEGDGQVGRLADMVNAEFARAKERIQATAADAAKSLDDHLQQSSNQVAEMAKMMSEARLVVAEGATCREQVSHLIRDVWELTSTAQQRSDALVALVDQTSDLDKRLNERLQRAEAASVDLTGRVGTAEKCTKTLSGQQEQVRQLCTSFGEQIDDARHVYEQVCAANETGKALYGNVMEESTRLTNTLSSAHSVMVSIEEHVNTAGRLGRQIGELSEHASELELRVRQFQDDLSNPLSIVEAARTQTAELSEICQAVKRVFSGVSQASLEARERTKTLKQLIGATSTAAGTLQQWIEEAGRAQMRLSVTLERAPAITDTHPAVVVSPPVTAQQHVDAIDDEIEALAEPRGVPAEPINTEKATAASDAVASLAQAVAKRGLSEPVDEQAAPPPATAQAAPARKTNRLTPDAVRALIEEAKRKQVMADSGGH